MSAKAQVNLQRIWENLHFSTVDSTIAREPKDVLCISLRNKIGEYPNGRPMFDSIFNSKDTRYKRRADVPERDRWRMDVLWHNYSGLTTDGIYLEKDGYKKLDLSNRLTMDWSQFSSAQSRPDDGQLICGEVIETPNGPRFNRWFICDEAFKLFVDIIRNGTELSDDELGQRLLTDRFHDIFWATARLVLFDNVQAFVDELNILEIMENKKHRDRWDPNPFGYKESQPPKWAQHPATGQVYGEYGFTVDSLGMELPYPKRDAGIWVHQLSYWLGEPQWWQDFLRLCEEQDVMYYHPSFNGSCNACFHENRSSGNG